MKSPRSNSTPDETLRMPRSTTVIQFYAHYADYSDERLIEDITNALEHAGALRGTKNTTHT